ncbi:hypothetical protein FisN_1Hu260 [Fistulifera solaris]|uniref:Uncharacterized protein n=1 Tax=Fistulifera solaris TaxID=1519565 RepID=A0A1Z5JEY5_FISSO|nr:hypothetical protein FisN_1Hu260 [Fistulifera solaris]|eukprot:GAX12328.1 hypothetical protein FisN_1Hu260 [Fistulifera solaris]
MGETILDKSTTVNPNQNGNLPGETSTTKMKGSYLEPTTPDRQNDPLVLKGSIISVATDEDFPEEQGQEILWVENEAELTTPNSQLGETTKLATAKRTEQIIADGSKCHIIVLPEPMIDTVPKEALELSVKVKDNVVSSESTLLVTAEKVAAAKQMLEQALNEKSMQRSSELSNKAFSLAMEARSLAELPMNTSEELTTIINDAITKGKAEVLKVQELNQQLNNDTLQIEGENHASRARSLMDFILPENKVATPKVSLDGYKLLSNTKLETVNSSDAIFKNVAKPKDFDVLSMSSLNEILDGPEEEATTTTPEQMTEKPEEKRLQEISTNASTEGTDAVVTNAGSASCDSTIHETNTNEKHRDQRKISSRRSGLFGGLFATRKEKKRKEKTTADTDAASLVSGNGSSCPEEPSHKVSNFDHPQVKIPAAAKRVQDTPIVDIEGIDSRKNVKIHFIQESAANRTRVDSTLERMIQNEKTEDSTSRLVVAAEEIYPDLLASDCSVSLPTDKSLTIAGHKPILKNRKGKARYGQNSKLRSPQTEDCAIRSKEGIDSFTNFVTSNANSMCDRYAVLSNDDDDIVEATNSFRTFLQSGDEKNIITLPGLDTISTLGTRSSHDQSPVRQRESSPSDKYHPEYTVPRSGYKTEQYHYHSAQLQTTSPRGIRIMGEVESTSKTHHKTAMKASKVPAAEMMKLQRGKRLKRKSIADLFGFGNANPLSDHKYTRSKPMNTPLIRKSDPPTKVKSLPTNYTEQGATFVLPHYRIRGLPDAKTESDNLLHTHHEHPVINNKAENVQASSHVSGPSHRSFSKSEQTHTVVSTCPESTKVFAQGLDKPTETDSTLSLCDDLEPEASHDTETRFVHAAIEEDPLVAHLKKQIGRQPRRGIDPTSAKVNFRSNRLDP